MARRWLLVALLWASPTWSATDPETGLVIDRGFETVKAYCTRCHSARLITQSGKTREGWLESIRWMQQNQGLWDLGTTEPEILDYLAKNYAPTVAPNRPQVMPLAPPPK
jgi:hypothetical protein